jgi:hypothetical protein
MDKNDFPLVVNENGFEIRERVDSNSAPYRVFHPTFSGVFIDDFETLNAAIEFCKYEDTDIWEDELMKV